MGHRITLIKLDRRISKQALPGLRGAIASMFPEDTMYHNHDGKALMYRYPMIQYKLISGKATIVGIDDGADSLDEHFALGQSFDLVIHDRQLSMKIIEKNSVFYIPESIENADFYYFLKDWLPLNQENWARYIKAESISEKIALLDNILSANILSLFGGFDYLSAYKSKASILEIVNSGKINYKGNEMLSFDIRFKCNAILPEFCGMGKGASHGFGTIYKSHPRN